MYNYHTIQLVLILFILEAMNDPNDQSDDDTNELIMINESGSAEQLMSLDGLPEPQIGPQVRALGLPGAACTI